MISTVRAASYESSVKKEGGKKGGMERKKKKEREREKGNVEREEGRRLTRDIERSVVVDF